MFSAYGKALAQDLDKKLWTLVFVCVCVCGSETNLSLSHSACFWLSPCHLTVYPSISLSVHLFLYLSVCLHFSLFLYVPLIICLPVTQSGHQGTLSHHQYFSLINSNAPLTNLLGYIDCHALTLVNLVNHQFSVLESTLNYRHCKQWNNWWFKTHSLCKLD